MSELSAESVAEPWRKERNRRVAEFKRSLPWWERVLRWFR